MILPTVDDERARLAALESYEIFGTSPERELDDLARLAAQICGTPIGLVTLVGADRQWFKAHIGLTVEQAPLEHAFCALAIRQPGLFVITDASSDQRVAANPLVTGAPHIRFYAGAPLLNVDGHALGTLCVLDRERRSLTHEQQNAVMTLAAQAMSLLEYRRTRSAMIRTSEHSRAVEKALQESEQFKTRVIEGSRDCIKVLDLDGRLLSMNAGGMETLEICDFAPLRNSPWPELWPEESRAMVHAAVATARDGGIGRFVGFCPTAAGNPRWWDVAVNAILDETSRPERLLAISRDITDRRNAEELLRAITEGTAAATGTAFFSSLVRHLAVALRVRRVFIAECLEHDRARSRAVWMGKEQPNFEYSVTETPCMKVTQGQTCLYSKNVRKYFPANAMLSRLNAESYLGVPLWNSSHRVIGHIVIVDDKPMSEDPLWISVLQTFAARAGVELEREQADEKLREALAEVERLKNQLQAENVYLQEEIRKEHNFAEMVGNGPALLALLRKVERVAETDATVLIHGETGTGKELIARALHNSGLRKQRPLVKVNCGAVPPSLLESELFGHVKGAFTGAIDRRVGRFELANGGTLFLDEIGELPLETQVKLLRVLQEQEFEPVGGNKTVRVDVRIIAATNRDLHEEVRAGRFRADLFFRLNVVPLTVPPLRDRTEDIPLLVAYFVSRFAKKFGRTVEGVTRDTMALLVSYPWPGNVRELQNVIERAVVLSPGSLLTLGSDLLPVAEPAPSAPSTATESAQAHDSATYGDDELRADFMTLSEAQRLHIESVLAQTHGVIEGPSGAARILNVHPNTLRSRMKKLGLQRRSHEMS